MDQAPLAVAERAASYGAASSKAMRLTKQQLCKDVTPLTWQRLVTAVAEDDSVSDGAVSTFGVQANVRQDALQVFQRHHASESHLVGGHSTLERRK